MKQWMLAGMMVVAMFVGTACAADQQPKPNGEMEATIKRVVDGDTFELSGGEKVRMIGVDTPEVSP